MSLANRQSAEDDPESHLANPISRGCRASRALLKSVGDYQELEAVPLPTIGVSQALEEFNERNYRILMDLRRACDWLCALFIHQE